MVYTHCQPGVLPPPSPPIYLKNDLFAGADNDVRDGGGLGGLCLLYAPPWLKTAFAMLYPPSFALLSRRFTLAFLLDSTGFWGYVKAPVKTR